MPAPNHENITAHILVVDDDPSIQRMFYRLLQRVGYNVVMANNGNEAFQKISQSVPDLILMDLCMPGLDGFQMITCLRKSPATQDIPIILITGLDTSQNHVKALDLGANDFMSKTAFPEEVLARIRSHVKIKHLNDQLRDYRVSLEKMVALRTAQLKEASLEVIWHLAAASEYRDNETGTHIKRMSRYAAAIAAKMNLPEKTVEAILYAAPMHDIGKLGIPDNILLKPGKLTGWEWEIMQKHTIIGAEILKDSKIGFVRLGAMIALNHHERWDGSGYPFGLKGKKIPLAARIAALADALDAMTSNRPYKQAASFEKACDIIQEQREKQFDPDVVAAFFLIRDEILEIQKSFQHSI